jgi:hypothetical protein
VFIEHAPDITGDFPTNQRTKNKNEEASIRRHNARRVCRQRDSKLGLNTERHQRHAPSRLRIKLGDLPVSSFLAFSRSKGPAATNKTNLQSSNRLERCLPVNAD